MADPFATDEPLLTEEDVAYDIGIEVARRYGVPGEDMLQETWIWLHLNGAEGPGWGRALERHLTRLAKREHRQRGGRYTLPLEATDL